MRARVVLVGLLLMADFLGGTSGVVDEQGEAVDFLGRLVPTAFKSQPALPSGAGPAPGVAAAPSTIGGAGTAPGAGVASAGGERAGTQGPSTLAQIAQALGLATKTGEAASRLGQQGGAPTGEFGDFLTRSGLTPEQFDSLLQSLPPGWTEGMDIPGLDELKFAPPPEIPDVGAGPAPVGGDPGAPGIGPAGAVGLAGTALGVAGSLSGNPNVSRAGQAVGMAGNAAELGVALGGGASAGSVLALPALGYSAMSFADQLETEARVRRDVANAKNILGAKVPSAVSRLGKTLNDISSLDPASATTEQLLAAQQSLQAARQEFNAVDHAFKGGLTVAGKPINTGLTLDMVKPQLDALNESQLRIQDALESRGVKSGEIPGYQSPMDWLNFVAPDFYNSVRGIDANALKNFERDPAYYGLDPNDPTLAMARDIGAIQPGQTEAGLRGYIAGRKPPVSSAALVRAAFGDQGGGYADAASHVDAP